MLGLAFTLGSAGPLTLVFLPFLGLAFFSPASSSVCPSCVSVVIGDGTEGGGAIGAAGAEPGTGGAGAAPGTGSAGEATGGGLAAPNEGGGAIGPGVGRAPGTAGGAATGGRALGKDGGGAEGTVGRGPPPSLGPPVVEPGTLSLRLGLGGWGVPGAFIKRMG